jgi:hypothetical protein
MGEREPRSVLTRVFLRVRVGECQRDDTPDVSALTDRISPLNEDGPKRLTRFVDAWMRTTRGRLMRSKRDQQEGGSG